MGHGVASIKDFFPSFFELFDSVTPWLSNFSTSLQQIRYHAT